MKKSMFFLVVVTCLMFLPLGVQAYTITDAVPDAIGVRTFEGYGINMYNYTPGVYSGNIKIDLFTNYPEGGLTVGGWVTEPADVFIYENYYGNDYTWAIPLVDHGSFIAGNMYAVGSFLTSNDFEPAGGGYIYNENIPVRIDTIGNNYGWTSFGGGSVLWTDITPPGSPDWKISIDLPIYQDDPNGTWGLLWGTATCANDVVTGTVPEPATMLLLGAGLIGLAGAGRKKFFKKG